MRHLSDNQLTKLAVKSQYVARKALGTVNEMLDELNSMGNKRPDLQRELKDATERRLMDLTSMSGSNPGAIEKKIKKLRSSLPKEIRRTADLKKSVRTWDEINEWGDLQEALFPARGVENARDKLQAFLSGGPK